MASAIFHIVRFILERIRDSPSYSEQFSEEVKVLCKHLSELKKLAGDKLFDYTMDVSYGGGRKGGSVKSPYINAYCSIVDLLGQKIMEYKTEDFPNLHKISVFFMECLDEYQPKETDFASRNDMTAVIFSIACGMDKCFKTLEMGMKSKV